jgi:putative flavoprotein involved in K+ transport
LLDCPQQLEPITSDNVTVSLTLLHDVPLFGRDGAPVHERGVASEPGRYFLGLDFLYSFASENGGGVYRDAKHIAKHIASR